MLYPKTIEDDDPPVFESTSSENEEDESIKVKKKTKKSRKKPTASNDFVESFVFDTDGLMASEPDHLDGLHRFLKKSVQSTLQEKIDQERKKHQIQLESDKNGDEEDEKDDSDKLRSKPIKGSKPKTQEKADFFDLATSNEAVSSSKEMSFHDLNLSRPILKAVTEAGFIQPTPIQAACIPVALAGRDICACSATGTGKTAAFMLPILERLLYRPKQKSVTRVLVLVPTRELAIQVFQVSRNLAKYTNVELCLAAGGLDLKAQEAALRLGLDVVIATPGRLIDHLHNSPNFSLQDIEVLVLDEADRMLDEAFAEQMKEVIRLCSRKRQTMLFSATMTDEIEDLVKLSLNKPVRLFVNENTDTAMNLRQEFIRVRQGREQDREPIVSALVTRNFTDHTIIFVKTKKDCERMHILLGLLGVKVAQLHGGLSQSQRVQALAKFKSGEIDVLCSTDLAARGLDIEGVMTVINMHMPMTVKHYVHRVGRTARAGKTGRSISLVGEEERKILKSIMKLNKGKALTQRIVEPDVITAYKDRIDSLNPSIQKIEEEEKLERATRQAEKELEKTENKLKKGEDDREGRVWFQSKQAKQQEKKKLKAEFKKKLEEQEKKKKTPEQIRAEKEVAFHAREAKRARKGKKIRAVVEGNPSTRRGANGQPSKKKKKSSFTSQLTSVGSKAVKRFRYGPDDAEFRQAKRAKMDQGVLRKPKRKR